MKQLTNYSKDSKGLARWAGYMVIGLMMVNIEAYGFDLDAGIKAATDPVKSMINTYYPVGIFITGAIGAIMQQQGDLRDRMLGFGKGSLIGGLTVMAVKAGLGV